MVLGKILVEDTLLKSGGFHMEEKTGDASHIIQHPPQKKVEKNFQKNEEFLGIIVNCFVFLLHFTYAGILDVSVITEEE